MDILVINSDGIKTMHKVNTCLIASIFTRDLIEIREALSFHLFNLAKVSAEGQVSLVQNQL